MTSPGPSSILLVHDAPPSGLSASRRRTGALTELLFPRFKVAVAGEPFDMPGVSGIAWVPLADQDLARAIDAAHALIVPNRSLRAFAFLFRSPKPLIVDMTDPLLRDPAPSGERDLVCEVENLHRVLQRSDFFLCDGQDGVENVVLGMLLGTGRINPDLYARDRSLRSLLMAVPSALGPRDRTDETPESVQEALGARIGRLIRGESPHAEGRRWSVRFRRRPAPSTRGRTAPGHASPRPLLMATSESIGPRIAGTGVRSVELANVLSAHFRVTVACPSPATDAPRLFTLVDSLEEPPNRLAGKADVVITDPETLSRFPRLRNAAAVISIDLSCPNILENLEHDPARDAEKKNLVFMANVRTLFAALERGDHFFCAGAPQRDLWLGFLGLLGRTSELNATAMDIVPFGIPSADPPKDGGGLRERIKALKRTDRILLWNGGIWPWVDPETCLRAVSIIAETRDDVKLVFTGTRKPFAGEGVTDAANAAEEMSQALGLLNRTVFFLDWVGYGERHRVLNDADLALCTHKEGLETRFSYRTRFIDCLWTRLPLVITEGGIVSDLVARHGLGATVPAGDPARLAEVITALLDDPHALAGLRKNLAALAPEYTWERTSSALVGLKGRTRSNRPAVVTATFPLERLRRSWYYVRRHGPATFLKHLGRYLRRSRG